MFFNNTTPPPHPPMAACLLEELAKELAKGSQLRVQPGPPRPRLTNGGWLDVGMVGKAAAGLVVVVEGPLPTRRCRVVQVADGALVLEGGGHLRLALPYPRLLPRTGTFAVLRLKGEQRRRKRGPPDDEPDGGGPDGAPPVELHYGVGDGAQIWLDRGARAGGGTGG